VKDFQYAAAASIDEAVSLLSAGGQQARPLAGGTDIIVQLREGLREADFVVDLKQIPDLMRLECSREAGLRLGAAVPCYRIYGDPRVAQAYPGLCDAARIIGGWQIQSRASIGGNLCNSSPAADSIPALIAYGAVCHIAGPDGPRQVPVEQFCTGVGQNCLRRGELLVTIELPPPAPRSGACYLRFIPRNEMDIAVVGAGAWVQLDGANQTIEQARIGLAAVAPTPLYAAEASAWLAGKPAVEESYRQAGELAKRIARPISDRRGTAEYRTHLVGVLTARALAGAVKRAQQAS
jgi:carbon-monoxide dehydrogenase medium subunit